MAFPASLAQILLTGTFKKYPSGTPATGKVVITSNVWLQGPTDNAIVPPFKTQAILDSNGSISLSLPATNDPDWTPQNWSYYVEITTSDSGRTLVGSLALPYDGGPVDLADVLNTATPTPGQTYVPLSSRGAPGGVAALGQDGKVPAGQLPTGSGGGGSSDWADITNKPSTFPPSAHTHPQTDVVGLSASLATKADASTAVLTTDTRLSNARTPTAHASTHGSAGSDPITVTESQVTGLTTDLAAKAPLANPTFTGTVAGVSKSMVGLGSVDNTSDASKPVSTAQQTALDLKANSASPTFTGTVSGVTKAMVGLGNVDNTADASKTFAESQITGLTTDLSNLSTAIGTKQPLDSDLTAIAGLTATTGNVIQSVGSTWASQTPAQVKSSLSLVKGDVGLGNVDNTSDAGKPVSTAQQTALDLKAPLASPALTGTPTATTPTSTDNSTRVATTAFVKAFTAPVLVISGAGAVPGGTPAGTVIVRY